MPDAGARRAPGSDAWIALSPAAQDRPTRRDVLSLLGPAHRASKGMFRRVRGVEFGARGYATDHDGIGGRDDVTSWHAPARSASRNGAGLSLHPYRISLASSYTVDRAGTRMPAAAGLSGPFRHCARLATDPRTHWTAASTARQAMQAAVVLAMSKAAIAAGTLHVTACDGSPADAGCDGRLGSLSIADLDMVDGTDPDGRLRLDLEFKGGVASTIMARLTDDRVTPVAIDRVALASFVVVT